MRYSVSGATVKDVKTAGGLNIKEAPRTKLIFATLTKNQATQLRSSGFTVTEVGGVKPAVMPPVPIAGIPTYTPEGLLQATGFEDLRTMMAPPLYGSGFNTAVIDTGIRETHEGINGRVVHRENFTSDPMRDGFNHGTGVASIIVAVAPLCNVLNMKVLDDNGEGTEEEVVLAIDECIELHDTDPSIAPSVINLSLGASDDGNPNNPLRVACRAAVDRGIYILAAAGNEGPDPGTVMSPACERYVGAVGSLKYEPFTISSWSSRGPTKEGLVKPDGVFFGEDIVMASSESDTAVLAKSGTSFAVPFYTGACLLFHEGTLRRGGIALVGEPPAGVTIIEWPQFVGPKEMMDVYLVQVSVKPTGSAVDKDNSYGYGLVYGPLVAQVTAVVPALDISAMLTGLITVAMVGMMMKMVK